jgi:dihydroxyacid dehydratase/phosphogluconate dehydratase
MEHPMSFDPRHKSRTILEGTDRAVARSMMKAAGFTDADLAKPQIGVAHCWIGTMPCNLNHRDLAQRVMDGIRAAGGNPVEINTIAINDGITTGTEGMKTSLVSRELIADSVELVARGHMLDAIVTISGCDKTIPAMAMVLGRLDIPGLTLYSGSIASGHCHKPNRVFADRKLTIQDAYESIGAFNAGRIDAEEFKDVEDHACPAAGACGGQFTANTMATAYEMLGISLRGANDVPALHPAKVDVAYACGTRVMELLNAGITPRSLVNRRSFENAITGVMATGGSTNAVLHLLATAHDFGVELALEDFDRISRKTPVVADMRPWGTYTAPEMFDAGGMAVVGKRLLEAGLLSPDEKTVSGRTIGEEILARGRACRPGRRQAARASAQAGRRPRHPAWHAGPRRLRHQGVGPEEGRASRPGARVRERGRGVPGHQGRSHPAERRDGAAVRRSHRRAGHARDAARHRRDPGRRARRDGGPHHRWTLLRRHTRIRDRPHRARGREAWSHRRIARWRHRRDRRREPSPGRGSHRRPACRAALAMDRTGTALHDGVLAKYARLVSDASVGAVTDLPPM